MSYCDVNFIRRVTGIKIASIGDSDLANIRDDVAAPELNHDIQYTVENEEVLTINEEKENDVNGTNKTFYARDVHDNKQYIGDRNDDQTIDGDDIYAYSLDSNGNRTEYDVSSLDDSYTGKFTLSTAPGARETLYISYVVSPIDLSTPHPLVKVACAQLSGAYGVTNIEASRLKKYKVGKVTIEKTADEFASLYSQYKSTVRKINNLLFQSGENTQKINEVFLNE